jgi:hypothetical protein
MAATTSGAGTTLTAFFDTRSDAERVLEKLRAAGIPDASVRFTEGAPAVGSGAALADDRPIPPAKGFFEALSDLVFPNEDRDAYAEALSRGGYLVTVVDLPEEHRAEALDILDDEGAVNIDERRAGWRSGGPGEYPAPAAEAAARPLRRDAAQARSRVRSYTRPGSAG